MPGDLTISGNLTVSGTTTTVDSNTVTIADNILTLNSDATGTASQNESIIRFPSLALEPLFINKASANKYYPYVIALNERDYHEVVAKGDGSKEEEMSKSVKVDVKYLGSLRPSDLITDYMLLKLKEYLNV